MPQITYVGVDGREHSVPYAPGDDVMAVAVNNDVPGIEGECGGEMNCGTCHVYVSEAWKDRLEAPDWDEEGMLDVVEDRCPNSRLGCQLKLRDDHDGMVVTIAPSTAGVL